MGIVHAGLHAAFEEMKELLARRSMRQREPDPLAKEGARLQNWATLRLSMPPIVRNGDDG
jgi:hypothetical protein